MWYVFIEVGLNFFACFVIRSYTKGWLWQHLKEPVKIFIVQSLACRDTPQEVAELVQTRIWNFHRSCHEVAAYDPN